MTRVVLAASQKAAEVAVIDFTTPAKPTVTPVQPKLQGTGYTVALAGSLGVIGSYAGAVIKMQTINVTNPAAPVLNVPIPIRVSGVSAIAIESTHSHVAIGELSGGQVTLFDIESGTPAITVQTPISPITSVAFYGSKLVAVAGHESKVGLIDFSVTPAQISYISPNMGTNLTVGCDAGLIAVGDQASSTVKLYGASDIDNAKATISNGLPGTLSLGLSGESALCGAISGGQAATVDFANDRAVTFPAQMGGGAVVRREGFEGVCASAASPDVALFQLATSPPGPYGPVVQALTPSIQSIGLGSFSA
jgi:hypothetical protein